MPQMKDITPLGVFRHYSISQYWAVSDATTAEHAPNMHLITPQCTSTLRHIKEALGNFQCTSQAVFTPYSHVSCSPILANIGGTLRLITPHRRVAFE